MKQREAAATTRRWTAISIAGVALAVVLLLMVLPLLANRYWDQPVLWIGLPLCYVAAALWLRSRLMMSALAGLVLGAMLIDTERRTQGETYQIWQPVWAVGVGLLIGVVIGFIWDRASHVEIVPQQGKPKKRR